MESSYLTPGIMTNPENHPIPPITNLTEVARTVQGLLIHENWAPRYEVELTDPETVHVRPVSALLDVIMARDPRPLEIARDPAARTTASCRTFTVLTVSMLRAIGTPARARCGFAGYFVDGWNEDHWIVEYRAGDRWKLADIQLDELQLKAIGADFDPLDLPRDRFLTAVEAWTKIRAGEADAATFGIEGTDLAGQWFVAGEVLHDRAALQNVETLPWDAWDPMPSPEDEVDLALFDRYAAGEEPVKVPDPVFNTRRRRPEPLTS
jgi:hypothetical protein